MTRTILEIAREAAERDGTAQPPKSLFNSNDRNARILRQAAKDTMREYLRTSGWQGMSELHSDWVFVLQPGRYAYPLPPDFLRIIPNTEQRNGWPLGFVGPASPQVWSAWVHGREAVASPMGWRIKNNAIFIEPVPKSIELVAIEYVSRFPVVSEPREGDMDLSTSPPRAIAPLVPRDGFISIPDVSEFVEDGDDDGEYGTGSGYDIANWPEEMHERLRRISLTTGRDPLFEVRRPEFASDDDRVAFDDDYILSIGMTFRLRRALGLPYSEHAAEYEAEMDIKGNSDAGAGGRSFSLGCDDRGSSVVPLGGGSWLVS